MRIILAATAASLLAAPAAAETFQTSSVSIQNTAAELVVIPEDRTTIDVSIGATGALPAIQTRMTNDGLVVDGGLGNRLRGCSTNLTGRTVIRIRDLGNVAREDLPRITLRVPRTLDLSAGGAVYSEIGASAGGELTLNGCGSAEVARAGGPFELTLNGSGDVDAEAVGGALEATLNGSGSLRIARAEGPAELQLNGSGDLTIGDIGGAVDARLAGSGTLRAGAVAGHAEYALTGSGDINAGAVRGSLEAELRGSGNVRIASVEGQSAALTLSASGTLQVHGGRVAQLDARNSGSGNVRFAGSAAVTRAAVSGSGNVSIADAGRVEQISDTGSGTINIGN